MRIMRGQHLYLGVGTVLIVFGSSYALSTQSGVDSIMGGNPNHWVQFFDEYCFEPHELFCDGNAGADCFECTSNHAKSNIQSQPTAYWQGYKLSQTPLDCELKSSGTCEDEEEGEPDCVDLAPDGDCDDIISNTEPQE